MTTGDEKRRVTVSEVFAKAAQNRGSAGQGDAVRERRGLDWDSINDRLRQAVEFKTNMMALQGIDSVAVNGQRPHQEGFGEQASGLAALVSSLSQALKSDHDPTQNLMALMDYVQRKDTESLQNEVRELKQALMSAGGNSTLETLQALHTMGILRNPEDQHRSNPLLEALQVMKELGITEKPQQPSFFDQLNAMLSVMEKLRPQQPQQTFQLPNGLTGTFEQLLQLYDLMDRREQRRHEFELQQERAKAVREMWSQVADAFSSAAAYLREQEEEEPTAPAAPAIPPAQRRQQRAPRKAPERDVREIPCDHCQAPNRVDIAQRPEGFICASCGQRCDLQYDEGA